MKQIAVKMNKYLPIIIISLISIFSVSACWADIAMSGNLVKSDAYSVDILNAGYTSYRKELEPGFSMKNEDYLRLEIIESSLIRIASEQIKLYNEYLSLPYNADQALPFSQKTYLKKMKQSSYSIMESLRRNIHTLLPINKGKKAIMSKKDDSFKALFLLDRKSIK